jgi:hypothetical protein
VIADDGELMTMTTKGHGNAGWPGQHSVIV